MQLPHLLYLRSFEAAARHMSFTGASTELNCTQSAVSHHVRSLEEYIGRPLFVRHARSLSLTDVGEAYLPTVRHALQEIDVATQSLVAQSHKREVVLSCPFSLAENWLPRVISDFNAVHPDVDLVVHATVWADVEERVSDMSISMHLADDISPGLTTLWRENLTLLCAPDFPRSGTPMARPEQLLEVPLIHVLGRQEYWRLAADALGLPAIDQSRGLRTSASNVAIEFAAQGLGCTVAPRSLAQTYLDRGLLVEPFLLQVQSPWVFCLKTPGNSIRPAVRLFRDWLLKAAGDRAASSAA